MTCFGSLGHKIYKNKMIKQLRKSLEEPETYIELYNKFLEHFKEYDDKTAECDVEEIFNHYLKSKGLKIIGDITREIMMKTIVEEDNIIVLEIQQNVNELNEQMINLQEMMIKNLDNTKDLRKRVNYKMAMMEKMDKKTHKNTNKKRSVITAD